LFVHPIQPLIDRSSAVRNHRHAVRGRTMSSNRRQDLSGA
jgi:hypothetical protein